MGEKEASIKVESTKSDGSDGGPAFEASVTTQTAPTAPTTPPSKTKIEERLKLAVEEAEIDKNRSSDLVPLTQEYDKLKKTLRSLVANAKMYHQHSIIVQKSRDDMIHNLAILSQDSPIYAQVGTPLDGTAAQNVQVVMAAAAAKTNGNVNANKESDSNSPVRKDKDIVTVWQGSQPQVSLQSIQQLASAQGLVDTMEFQSQVLDYVIEWDTVVTTRIDSEWKDVKKLAADRGHYETKVQGLRQKSNDMEIKGGKSTPSVGTVERLDRNEKKLQQAFEIHELAAGKLCVLMREATKGGWRDLYPLVVNVMTLQANRIEREHEIHAQLLPTLEVLKFNYEEADKKTNSK